jgi:hypothetical protein
MRKLVFFAVAATAAGLSCPAMATGPVRIVAKTNLLDFEYGWSAEAAELPALDRRFRANAARRRATALAQARAERASRRASKMDFNGNQFSHVWTTSGQSPGLLSLQGEIGEFTGGAHPNSGSTALLWDRRGGREIKWTALTTSSTGWTGAVRHPFCVLLDRERADRRQAPVDPTDMFGQCPALGELTIAPLDLDHDQRFDHLRITADPYVAGPYAEGDYEIDLPVTAAMLARLKPVWRRDFEARPPVR